MWCAAAGFTSWISVSDSLTGFRNFIYENIERKGFKMNMLDELKELKEKMNNIDWDLFIEKEHKKFINGQLKVANKEYCNWLESFINNLPEGYDDETWAYKTIRHNKEFTQEDLNNERFLDAFCKFLNIVADEQRVKEYHNDDFFEEYEYIFKYNNQYYKWNTLIGQGSVTTITKVDKPRFAFIDLDLYFSNN